jgi:hypothetical protein
MQYRSTDISEVFAAHVFRVAPPWIKLKMCEKYAQGTRV